MEKENKFRAWDDDAEIMIYSDSHEIENADYWWEIDPLRLCRITGSTGGNTFEPPEDIVTYYDKIMQFTGLEDLQGERLYEGDICNNEVAEWEIIFNKGCFCARMLGHKYPENQTHLALRAIKGLVKIGNIYENHELL